jgi:hypothetical protein
MISARYNFELEGMYFFPYLGADLVYYTTNEETASGILGEEANRMMTLGSHLGLGLISHISHEFWFRLDMRYGFGPGVRLDVNFGFVYAGSSSGDSESEEPQ